MTGIPGDHSHLLLLGRHLGVVPPGTFDGQQESGSVVVSGTTIWMFDDHLNSLLQKATEPVPVGAFYSEALNILGSPEVVEDLLGEEKLFLFFEWDFIGDDSLSMFGSISFLPTVDTIVIDDHTGMLTVSPFEYRIGRKREPSIFTLEELDREDLDALRRTGVDIPLDLAGLFDNPENIIIKDFIEETSSDTSWETSEFLQVFLDHIGDITRSGCGNLVHVDLLD